MVASLVGSTVLLSTMNQNQCISHRFWIHCSRCHNTRIFQHKARTDCKLRQLLDIECDLVGTSRSPYPVGNRRTSFFATPIVTQRITWLDRWASYGVYLPKY
ncbi:hypothetical protein BDR07DRAFT_1422651 [Suillus spraguei]|nr:hypothetical protein BDR07DRAFT_1422651 [Suillus spraguei]